MTLTGLRNPIHLARLILEYSTQPLSLRRVPPNLLVGPSALDFAAELGVSIVHPDLLVSPAAGERYERWKADLQKTESLTVTDTESLETSHVAARTDDEDSNKNFDYNLDLAPCWNESQPYTPRMTPSETHGSSMSVNHDSMHGQPMDSALWSHSRSGNDGLVSSHFESAFSTDFGSSDQDAPGPGLSIDCKGPTTLQQPSRRNKDSGNASAESPRIPVVPPPTRIDTPEASEDYHLDSDTAINKITRPDNITDTVGAIAIDCFGHIAAGSSSGGIGMKHRGRVGPAALVGIGTAVIPVEPNDESQLCVATVTSGTGEHMATTMAAGCCASRLYSTSRKGKYGASEPAEDENRSMQSFVEKDFMGKLSTQSEKSGLRLMPTC